LRFAALTRANVPHLAGSREEKYPSAGSDSGDKAKVGDFPQ